MAPHRPPKSSGRGARRARAGPGWALALGAALLLAAGAAGAQEEAASEPAGDEAGASAERGAAPGPLRAELNKLEERDGSCRVYLVLENRTASALEALRLDLVLFGDDGVILRRLAVDAGPLAPDRTRVRLFDVEEVPCEQIGRLLLNGILACEDEEGEPMRCAERLELGSRAGIPFER